MSLKSLVNSFYLLLVRLELFLQFSVGLNPDLFGIVTDSNGDPWSDFVDQVRRQPRLLQPIEQWSPKNIAILRALFQAPENIPAGVQSNRVSQSSKRIASQ